MLNIDWTPRGRHIGVTSNDKMFLKQIYRTGAELQLEPTALHYVYNVPKTRDVAVKATYTSLFGSVIV